MSFSQGFYNTGSALDTYKNEYRPLIEQVGVPRKRKMDEVDLTYFLNVMHQNLRKSVSRAYQVSKSINMNFDLSSKVRTFLPNVSKNRINTELGLRFESISERIYFYDQYERSQKLSLNVIDQYYEEQRSIFLLSKRYKLYEVYRNFYMQLSLYDYFHFELDRNAKPAFKPTPRQSFKDFPLAAKIRNFHAHLEQLNTMFLLFDEFDYLKPEIKITMF